MDSRSSLNFDEDSTLAEDGLSTSIENESLFRSTAPLAASTVARDNRRKLAVDDIKGGSFLDAEPVEMSGGGQERQLHLSFSALDQSNTSQKVQCQDVRGSQSAGNAGARKDDSLTPHVSWGSIAQEKIDSSRSDGRNSSLGLIQVDAMSDLSASVFQLDGMNETAKGAKDMEDFLTPVPTSTGSQTIQTSTNTSSKSSSGIDWLKPDVETIKKRPSTKGLAEIEIGGARQSLFGCASGPIAEESEGDVTVPEVQFMEDELNQLDNDFGNFDVDESMADHDDFLMLERQCEQACPEETEPQTEATGLDSKYFSSGLHTHEGGDGEERKEPFPSLSKVALFDDMGSVEDIPTGSVARENKKRPIQKVHQIDRLMYRSDGSEIDTDDELEMARQAAQMDSERGTGAGQSSEVTEMLRPGIEGTSLRENGFGDQNLSLTVRYSAEGDVVNSPVPGDGGGGGDGESGSDSEVASGNPRNQSQVQEFLETFRESFKPTPPSSHPLLDFEEQRVKPMGDDLLTEKGPNRYSVYQDTVMDDDTSRLQSRFLAPMSPPVLNNSASQPGMGFDESSFQVDDIFKQSQGGPRSRDSPGERGDRLEASGFNINDIQNGGDNPFNGIESSFGSFGASPPASQQADRQSQESVWTQLNMSPLSHRTSGDVKSQSSPSSRTSWASIGSQPRHAAMGLDNIRQDGQGQEESDGMAKTNGQQSLTNPSESGENQVENLFKEPRLSLYRSQIKRKAAEDTDRKKAMYGEPFPSQKLSQLSPVTQKDTKGQHKVSIGVNDPPAHTNRCQEPVSNLESSFADMVEAQKEQLNRQFDTGELDRDLDVGDDAFITADKVKSMLDEDEEEFEKENIFREDARIATLSGSPESSWMYKSKMSLSCPSSLREEFEDPALRISIGTFLKSRSGALGSLDGDGGDARPEFGMQIKTPPENRKPLALIDSPTCSESRTAGVGNDESIHDKTVTINDLENTPKVQDKQGLHQIQDQSLTPIIGSPLVNDVFTPDRSEDGGSSGQKKPINESLNVSEISRLLTSAPKGTQPKDLVQIIVALAESKKQSTREPKPSKLPVMKGSGVLTKLRSSESSPVTSVSVSSEHNRSIDEKHGKSDSEKEKPFLEGQSSPGHTELRHNGEYIRSEMKNDIQKTKPDGEESDTSLSPISRSQNATPSDFTYRSKNATPTEQNGEKAQMSREVRENFVKSPRSSTTSLGLTGHHIPDGTDYSIQADYPHQVQTAGMSREDLVGTEDIQLADSRGFDLILQGNKYFTSQNGHQREITPVQQQVPVQIQDRLGGSQNDQSSRQGTNMQYDYVSHQDRGRAPQAGVYLRDTGSDYSGQRQDLPVQQAPGQVSRASYPTSTEHLPTQAVPPVSYNHRTVYSRHLSDSELHTMQLARSLPNEQQNIPSFSPPGKALSHEQDKTDSSSNSVNSHEQVDRKLSQSPSHRYPDTHPVFCTGKEVETTDEIHDDRDLMPPPPVPSFRHNLVPKNKASDPPLLLTNQSLLKSSFAQQYLVRDAPGKVVSKPLAEFDVRGFQNSEDSSMLTPDQQRHRRGISEGGVASHSLANMSTFPQVPAYQSTPYGRDSTLASHQFFPLENTMLTNSTMHTQMSTGSLDNSSMFVSTPADKDLSSNMVAPKLASSKFSAIESPGILRFTEVCCVGISTKASLPLTNPTNRWLECLLQIRHLSIDNHSVGCETTNPFEMKQKVIVEPNTTEKLEVIFLPRVPGAYVAQLLIYSHLFLRDRETEVQKIPTEVTVQAIAEKPNIEVLGLRVDGELCMNFGQVTWGSCRQLAIGIVNYGQSRLPLRMSISSNKVPWHCFAFDRGPQPTSADISVVSRCSKPQSPALGRTVMTLCLPGNLEGDPRSCEQDVRVWCRPPDKRVDRALANCLPDEMTARIDIEVDTPTSNLPPIQTIYLKALVGVARLHISKNLEMLKLKSVVGQRARDMVTLKNAGNIDLQVTFYFPELDELFTARPITATISPGKESQVNVEFSPMNKSLESYETALLMHVEPEGPTYEVPVRGEVLTVQSTADPMLLSDRRFLSYGGVAVGKSVEKKVTLKNLARQPLKLKVEIRSESHDFKLRSTAIQSSSFSECRDLIVQPLEKYPVYVAYCPTTVSEQHGKLVIKPYDTTFKYSIPITGYGGVSKLLLEGASITDRDRYCVDMGEIIVGRECGLRLVVRNLGVREAYVKAVCFTDSRCRKDNISNRVTVEPHQFVLEEGATQVIVVVLNPSDREASLCSASHDVVATIAFFYGEELARQRFRQAQSQIRNPRAPSKTVDPVLTSINFDQPFINEDHLREQPVPPGVDAHSHVDTFYSTMSRLYLSLVGSPVDSSLTKTPQIHSGALTTSSQGSWQANTSVIPVRDTNRDSAAKSGTLPLVSKPLYGEPDDDKDWIIQPDCLILNVSSRKDDKLPISKFQITNFKNKKLLYELCWPGQKVKLTPEGGIIEPKATTSVCISPSALIHQQLEDLPWSGTVQVNCNHQTKTLRVQIRTDITVDGNIEISNKTLVPTFQSALQTIQLPMPSGGPLQASCRKVEFPATKVGEQSETNIELSNNSQDPMQWIVSSFAPPYVKGADSTKEVFRVMYKVFDFSLKFGRLLPGKTTQVNVQFTPRSKGTFTQYWDVQSKSDANAVRVQLTGEGLSNGAQESNYYGKSSDLSATSADSSIVKDTADKKRSEMDNRPISLKDDGSLKFSPCSVGQAQTEKISIKNRSLSPQIIEAVSPQPPFYVRHQKLEIKSKKYLRFPVEFRPSERGTYEGLIIFKTGLGYSLSVKLEAQCK